MTTAPPLSVRADIVEAKAGQGALLALTGEATGAAWRIVEVYSLDKLPVRVTLEWTAGQGGGRSASFDIARSGRVCVYARTVRCLVTNRATAKSNRIGASVGDAYAPTENVLDEHVAIVVAGIAVAVPEFASRVEVSLADRTLMATVVLELLDAAGAVVAQRRVSEIPPGGVALGACPAIKLSGADVAGRASFTLAL